MGIAGESPLPVGAAIGARLHALEYKSLLRFMTCGSVDDGKSTMIGRLLYDSGSLHDDQREAIEGGRDGTGRNEEIDFASVVDGLEAEREQGITIDVAYRYFSTDRRKFIVADCPGHEQYTRNMATAASTSDVAIVLVDSRLGVLRQTLRHSFIASLMGIRHVVLAVNKIDLVGYDEVCFNHIVAAYRSFAERLGFASIQAIPMSASLGKNITRRSRNMSWYHGPSLLEYLEQVPLAEVARDAAFRFPVQLVSRPNADFRGLAGEIASGSISVGDQVLVAKSRQLSRISEIVTADGLLDSASEGQAVTLVLEDHVDVSRGNMLTTPEAEAYVADQFQAHIVWFDANPLMPGRSYVLRTEVDSVTATITSLRYVVEIDSVKHIAAKSLCLNEIGVCNVSTQMPIVFDRYSDNRATGSFVLIDRLTSRTVGAGMINFPLMRSNIHWQALDVSRDARAALKAQHPAVLWLTGLSGSGKSTVANSLEKLLHSRGRHTYILDGDNLRHGLNRDLGFTDADRVENVRRVAEVARLMADAGLIVIVSFISPFASERRLARELMETIDFVEVFIDTPIEECALRDPKGLYKKAMKGKIRNFTGITSRYEPPENPELHLKTLEHGADELAVQIADFLAERHVR